MEDPELCAAVKKKPRTKGTRQIRHPISPILLSPSEPSDPARGKNGGGFSTFSMESSDAVSCGSSGVTVQYSNSRKRNAGEDEPSRRITRSYLKKQKESQVAKGNEQVEVSESSCVESISAAFECVVSGEISSKNLSKRTETVKKIEANDDVSASGVVEEKSRSRQPLATDVSFETWKNDTATTSVDESSSSVVVEQKQPKSSGPETDLGCQEDISYDEIFSDYSSDHAASFSELQSEIFRDSFSDLDFSDYTPSIFLDSSGSEFSEKSVDNDSPPSTTYSLLLQFKQQFLRSSAPLDARRSSLLEAPLSEASTFVRFEDEEAEECYRRLRDRERRQLQYVRDNAELHRSTIEDGDLIADLRSQMVHWIVEESTAKGFQQETMFLGVSLLDRFLSRGFFKNKGALQIVGIACLALATRIEENQPYNSVRQRNFCVGGNVYSRSEVVAMEWLVQEVLNFQCFLPTIHNFMWFYLKAARAAAEVEMRARYLSVLVLSDHEQLRHWPSTVAAALVILASLESSKIGSFERVIQVHARTRENDLPECIKNLEWVLQYASQRTGRKDHNMRLSVDILFFHSLKAYRLWFASNLGCHGCFNMYVW